MKNRTASLKVMLISLVVTSISGCSPFFKLVLNVKEPKVYETRQHSIDRISQLIRKENIQYLIGFRSANYELSKTDSSVYSQDLKIFNKEGFKLCLDPGKYNVCKDVSYKVITRHKIPMDSLVSDTSENISSFFNRIEYVNGKVLSIADITGYDYLAVIDWTTFALGLQNKVLHSLKESSGDKKVLYILVNKDIIKSDTCYFNRFTQSESGKHEPSH